MNSPPVAGQRVRAELDAKSLVLDWIAGSEFEESTLPCGVSHYSVEERLALVCEAFLSFSNESVISVGKAASVAGEARVSVEVSGAFKRHVALFAHERNGGFGHLVSSSVN
jgi:hypothetical protein